MPWPPRRSAEDRREEILAHRLRATSPRAATTAPRPRRSPARPASRSRTCSACSAPSASCSWPARTAATPTSPTCSAARRRGAPDERAGRDGHGLRASSCSPTATRCCSRCRATSPHEPEIRAHVRAGFVELVRDGRRAGRVSRPTRRGTSSRYGMLLNVIDGARLPARGREESVAGTGGPSCGRRGRCCGSLSRSCWPACSRCRCSASSARATTSTTRSAEAVHGARRRHRRATGDVSPRARAGRRWSGSARRADRPRRRRRDRGRRGGRLRDPGVAATAWRTTGPGGQDRALVSRDGRSTYLLADVPRSTTGAPARGSSSGSPVAAVRHARRRRVSRRARSPSQVLRGHRPRRADRVPDPLPALAVRLPQRGRRRCCRWPWAARRSCSASSRSGSSTSSTRMSIFALNLINGLGLGLAIDYSLFMVSRFREELAGRDATARRALAATMTHRRPHGRVQRDHRRRRAGGADRLPPALPVLDGRRRRAVRADRRRRVADAAARRCSARSGERVNAGGPQRWKDAIAREARAERSGFWYRHSQRVMRRPVAVATGAAIAADRARPAVHARSRSPASTPSVLPEDQTRACRRRRDQAPSSRRARRSPVYVGAAPATPPSGAGLRRPGCPAPRSAPPRIRATGRIDLIAAGPPLGDEREGARARGARRAGAVRRWSAARRPASSTSSGSLRAHLPLALAHPRARRRWSSCS